MVSATRPKFALKFLQEKAVNQLDEAEHVPLRDKFFKLLKEKGAYEADQLQKAFLSGRVSFPDGNILIKATAADARRPLPDMLYESNGYLYRTNSQGKLAEASGSLRLNKASAAFAKTVIGCRR